MGYLFRQPAKAAGLLVLSAAVALSAGCAQGGAGNNNMNPKQYSNDGYLGTTNANPHIPGRYMALNYANDSRMMQETLRTVDGVAGAHITFNGATAYVTLRLNHGIEARRVPTIERQAAAALRFHFPRYDIYVRSMTQ